MFLAIISILHSQSPKRHFSRPATAKSTKHMGATFDRSLGKQVSTARHRIGPQSPAAGSFQSYPTPCNLKKLAFLSQCTLKPTDGVLPMLESSFLCPKPGCDSSFEHTLNVSRETFIKQRSKYGLKMSRFCQEKYPPMKLPKPPRVLICLKAKLFLVLSRIIRAIKLQAKHLILVPSFIGKDKPNRGVA